ncbi:MAG TPA: hypothetical protein ENK59_04660 [Thioploca sp.]|nr:hypothetical protein [Thioploca sp.]
MKYITILFLLTMTVYADEAPIINLHTNFGLIVLELYPAKAPKTVENFLKYANSNFYDDTIFHRVIKKYIIQGGGYTKDYQKKIPLYDPIINESDNNLENLYGTIAMARSFRDPNSATSQFFINLKDNLSLNYNHITEEMGYTVFGKVIEGMDIIEKIQYFKTGAGGSLKKHVPQKQVIIEVVVVKSMAGTIEAIGEQTELNTELSDEMDEDYLENSTQIKTNIATSNTNVSKLTNDKTNIIESTIPPKIELLTVNFKIPVTKFTSKKIPIINPTLEKIPLNQKIIPSSAVTALSAPDMPSQPDISDPFPY